MRRAGALDTRRRIVAAARDLFVDQGFVATTMADIARVGGVAPQTVYAAFGTKRDILYAVMDVAIGGDDAPIGLLERPEPQRMRSMTDQRRQLEAFARGIGEVLGRAGPLFDVMRAAGAADPDIAMAFGAIQDERRQNMAGIVEWIVANGPLKPELTLDEAADILWTMSSADVHRMLCRERGWASARYAAWLAESLIDALLP